MTRVSFRGQGPFGPFATYVTVVDGVKLIPAALVRFACTTAKDAEDYNRGPVRWAQAERRVSKRMAMWGKRGAFEVIP